MLRWKRVLYLSALSWPLAGAALGANPVHLRMTTLAGPTTIGAQAVVDAWNAANPDIQVEVQQEPFDPWGTTAPTTMFAASDGPDLSWWWCLPSFQYKDLISAGLLLPLDDLYTGQYPRAVTEFFTQPDGHKYGINSDAVTVPYIFYNKKIFAEHGLTPPKTWGDWIALSQAIRAKGLQPTVAQVDIMNAHLAASIMPRVFSPDQLRAIYTNWSPTASDKDKEVKWTSPEGVRVWALVRDMIKKGIIADNYAGFSDPQLAKSLFTSGKAAMIQSGSWDSVLATDVKDFDVGYFYFPPIDPTGNTRVGMSAGNCFVGFNRQHAVETKKVLAFFASKQGATLWAQAAGLTPPRTDMTASDISALYSPLTTQIVAEAAAENPPNMIWSYFPSEFSQR